MQRSHYLFLLNFLVLLFLVPGAIDSKAATPDKLFTSSSNISLTGSPVADLLSNYVCEGLEEKTAFFFYKKVVRKCRMKIRGYGYSFIQLPTPPIEYTNKSRIIPIISGMPAYRQTYSLSTQYCYLFLLTPF